MTSDYSERLTHAATQRCESWNSLELAQLVASLVNDLALHRACYTSLCKAVANALASAG